VSTKSPVGDLVAGFFELAHNDPQFPQGKDHDQQGDTPEKHGLDPIRHSREITVPHLQLTD